MEVIVMVVAVAVVVRTTEGVWPNQLKLDAVCWGSHKWIYLLLLLLLKVRLQVVRVLMVVMVMVVVEVVLLLLLLMVMVMIGGRCCVSSVGH